MDIGPPPSPSWYRSLLRLYPARFRREASAELQAWSGALWRGAHGLTRVRLFLTLFFDLLVTLPAEWWIEYQAPRRRHPGDASVMDTFLHDLRAAWRTLTAAPLVLAIAVLTVALGIGSTTTMMSVANSLLLRPPVGVQEPGSLVTVHALDKQGGSFHSFSYLDYQALDSARGGLTSLAAYGMLPASLRVGNEEPKLEVGMLVSERYFSTLGTRPSFGRFFTPEEHHPGADPVVVLSDGLWRRRFGADPAILGRSITVNGKSLTVIGVAERGFHGQYAGIDFGLWAPLAQTPFLSRGENLLTRNASWLELIGRRERGKEPTAISAALSGIAAREGRLAGLDFDRGVEVRRYFPLPAGAEVPVGGFLGLLLLLAGFVLLIAGANVGTVLLARAATRAREMAVRVALGSGRGRLVRQLLLESLLLFALGGGLGTALAFGATRGLTLVSLPVPMPLVLDFHPDLLVLTLTLLMTLTVGVVFGLAPALQAARTDPALVLREGASTLRLMRGRLRGLLVTAQVAGSACLLVTAGLFARGLAQSGELRPGFDPAGVTVTSLDFGVRNYDDARALQFIETAERELAALPGVIAVATADNPPLNMSIQQTIVGLPDREPKMNVGRFGTDFATVTPGFFGTLRLPLREGRGFAAGDRKGAPLVAVVNESFAARIWPGERPLGKRLQFGNLTDTTTTEIVGVVADARSHSLGELPEPTIYVPVAQQGVRRVSLLVRTKEGLPSPDRAVRDAVHAIDPDLPVSQQVSYAALIGVTLLPNRVAMLLAAAFGATGLLLAALGLYGLLAFRVQSRRREIGIRIALGASTRAVSRLVVGEGVRLTLTGCAVGLVLAAVLARFLGSMLFGVSPVDPLTYLGIGVTLLLVGWLAALGPTLKALRTEPAEVLRND